jgi:hypothetical protein
MTNLAHKYQVAICPTLLVAGDASGELHINEWTTAVMPVI